MSRYLYLTIALGVIAILFACGYAKHINPPVYTYDTPTLTAESARLHARDIGGWVTLPVANTHSMEPLILGGDLLVIAPPNVSPYGSRLKGRVIGYHPEWNPKLFVAHRAVDEDGEGLLMEGDNVDGSLEHRENKSRVTAANYIGEVVGIYRTKASTP